MTTPALRMIHDKEGRIEYRTLGDKFVCSDLRTDARRKELHAEAIAAGRGDAHILEEMQWLISAAAKAGVDNFVIPHKTDGGKG